MTSRNTFHMCFMKNICLDGSVTRETDQVGREWLLLCLLPAIVMALLGNLAIYVTVSSPRLCTATFVYVKILSLIQAIFCVILVPFWLIIHFLLVSFQYHYYALFIEHKILPVLLNAVHFVLLFIFTCLPFRLHRQIHYLKYLRSWHSETFIAWRKLFWAIPFGLFLNVALYFQFEIVTSVCAANNQPFAVALSRFGQTEWLKLWLIRAAPVLFYWLSVFCLTALIVHYLQAFHTDRAHLTPWLRNQTIIKHEHLIRNMQPILLSLALSYSVVYLPKSVNILLSTSIDLGADSQLILFCYAYACPFYLFLIVSNPFRNEARIHLIDSTILKMNRVEDGEREGAETGRGQLSRENSEYNETYGLRSVVKGRRPARVPTLRGALKIDAVHRVRFIMTPNEIPRDPTSNSDDEDEEEGSDREEWTSDEERVTIDIGNKMPLKNTERTDQSSNR